MTTPRRRWADIAERTVWTLLQAGIGLAVIDALHIPIAWAAVAAGVLAVVKGELATKFGDGTAATLPASYTDTPTPEEIS